jgi:hypothetical protein
MGCEVMGWSYLFLCGTGLSVWNLDCWIGNIYTSLILGIFDVCLFGYVYANLASMKLAWNCVRCQFYGNHKEKRTLAKKGTIDCLESTTRFLAVSDQDSRPADCALVNRSLS